MKTLFSVLFSLCLFLSSIQVVVAQNHEFLSQDPSLVRASPPLNNMSPHRFYGNTLFGSPPHTTLTWYTHGSNAMNSDLIDVINSYKNLTYFPSWIDISTSESTQSSGPDVTLNFTSCPISGVACTVFDHYIYNSSRKVYIPDKYTIRYPNYSTYNDQEQHNTLSHELGHVLGLHHFDYCTSSTVMTPFGCNPIVTGPTLDDGWKLYKYYEACGQSCGKLEPDFGSLALNGTTISSSWINRNWTTSNGYFRYLKSNSQNGPWTPFHTQSQVENVGFWEDAVPQTNDQYILHVSKDVGSMTNNDWVLVCGRPKITWGVWGLEQCMPAIYVP